MTEVVSYDFPSLTGTFYTYYSFPLALAGQTATIFIGRPNAPTIGQGPTDGYVVAVGDNFGRRDYTGRTRIGITATRSTFWQSVSNALCQAPRGKGFQLTLLMTTGNRVGFISQAVSYDSGAVIGSSISNVATTGSISLTVLGTSFGLEPATITTRMGVTASESTIWVSDSTLRSKSPAGVHLLVTNKAKIDRDSSLVVTVKEYTFSTATTAFSFDSVALISCQFCNSLTKARDFSRFSYNFFNLTGSSIGTASYSPQGNVGFSAQPRTLWTSDNAVAGRSAPFANSNKENATVSITLGLFRGTLSISFTFDFGSVSSFKNLNSAPRGSSLSSIAGNGFGVAASCLSLLLGHTKAARTLWDSDSTIIVRSSAGVHSTETITLSIALITETTTESVTYDLPTLKRWYSENNVFGTSQRPRWRANGPGSGSVVLTLSGDSISQADYTPAAAVSASNTRAEFTQWLSYTSLYVRSVAGVGWDGAVEISLGLKVGSISQSWTHDKPTLSSLSLRNIPTFPYSEITAYGQNFGALQAGYTAYAEIGNTACEASVWISRTAVKCKNAAGTSNQDTVVVSAVQLVNSLSNAISYDVGLISTVNYTNIPRIDPTLSTVYGLNYGIFDTTTKVAIGISGAALVRWISDSIVTCKASAGIASSMSARITSLARKGTTSQVFSYDKSALIATLPTNYIHWQSTQLTVFGISVGQAKTSMSIRIGLSSSVFTDWNSDTLIFCKSSRSFGRSKPVTITSIRVASLSQVMSFDLGVFSSFFWVYRISDPFFSQVYTFQRYNFPSTPGGPQYGPYVDSSIMRGSLYLAGGGYFPMESTSHARLEGTGCESTTWRSSTLIVCRPASGSMQSRSLVISMDGVGGISSGSYSSAISYDNPFLSQLYMIRFNVPAGLKLTSSIFGADFSQYDATSAQRAGFTTCETSSWISSTTVLCGIGKGQIYRSYSNIFVATVGQQVGSSVKTFSYDVHKLSSILIPNAPSTGFIQMQIYGSNFGWWDPTASMRVGSTECEETTWISESCMSCLIPSEAMDSTDLSVSLTISGFVSTSSNLFSYDLSVVSSMFSSNLPSASISTDVVQVFVRSVGMSNPSPRVRIHFTSCPETIWLSDTTIKALCTNGYQSSLTIALSVARQISSLTQSVSYEIPILQGITFTYVDPLLQSLYLFIVGVSNLPTKGSVSVSQFDPLFSNLLLIGSNFGRYDNSLKSAVDGTAMSETKWLSQTIIRCKASAGIGATKYISMTSQEEVLTRTELFTYNSVLISALRPQNGAASAMDIMTLTGNFLGIQSSSVSGRSGQTAFLVTFWVSDTSLKCMRSFGVFRSVKDGTVVTSAIRTSSLSTAFSYNKPELSSIHSSNLPGTGSSFATVFGKSISSASFTPLLKIHITACEMSSWMSDTVILCRAPFGVSKAKADSVLVISLNTCVNSLSDSFSFHLPSVSTVRAQNIIVNTLVTSTGLNLGQNIMTITSRIGETRCQSSFWHSDTSVLCKIPSYSGSTKKFIVSLGLQASSLSQVLSYSTSSLSSVFPANLLQCTTILFATVSVYENSPMSRIGKSSSESTAWLSTTSLRVCTSSSVTRLRTQSVIATLSSLTETTTHSVSFDSSVLSSLRQANMPVTGSKQIFLTGTSLGLSRSASIKLGFTQTASTRWISQSALSALGASGVAMSRKVYLTEAGAVSTITTSISFDIPKIFSPGFLFTAGSVLILDPGYNYINGSFFCIGGGGSGLRGEVSVNSDGSIFSAAIQSLGSGYSQNPDAVVIAFSGTSVSQTGAITSLHIISPGYDYIAGDLIDTGQGNSSGFRGRFEVKNGSISEVYILEPGTNYWNDIENLTIVYSGTELPQVLSRLYLALLTDLLQSSSISQINIVSKGQNYVNGSLITVGGDGNGFAGTFSVNSQGQIIRPDFYTTQKDGTVTGISILEGGQNYIDGDFSGLASDVLSRVVSIFLNTRGANLSKLSTNISAKLFFPGTLTEQTGAVSQVLIRDAGQNYLVGPLQAPFLNGFLAYPVIINGTIKR
eukprot:766326-Hanusia_phi.AAC.4